MKLIRFGLFAILATFTLALAVQIAVCPQNFESIVASILAPGVTVAAIRLKPIESLKQKYTRNTGAAKGSYEEGVRNPRRSQSQQAVAAKETYAQAVQEAISNDSYAKGVQAAGDGKWAKGALEIGAGRFTQGAAAGADEWATNTKPIMDAIASVDLPPRGVKGSPENFDRARKVAEAAMAAAKK